MTRLEKCEILKSKGYTYDPETGKILNTKSNEVKTIHTSGYIFIRGSKHFQGNLYAQHFAWYWVYNNVDFEMLDHINRDRTDNRICNLRIVTPSQNRFNSNAKGYSWHKRNQKYQSFIMVDKKNKSLGYFDTEEEARNAYLKAKEIYHII